MPGFPEVVLWPLAAYLLGSIPFGVVITRRFSQVDIRRSGSGNIGATNVARTAGLRLATVVLAADLLKGFVPVLASRLACGGAAAPCDRLLALTALAAVVGHLYSIYTALRGGGKGVATTAGAFLAVCPTAVGAAMAVFAAVLWLGRRVSAASLAAAAALGPAVWLAGGTRPLLLAAFGTAALVILRHRDNIRRLIDGSEPPFRLRPPR